MADIELTALLKQPGITQTYVATQLGVTQGAVSQMLLPHRHVFVIRHPDGKLEAYEKKPIGRRVAKSSQRAAVEHHV